MTPQTKKVVVITISLLSLAGLSYFAYTYFSNKKEEEDLPPPSDTLPTNTTPVITTETGVKTTPKPTPTPNDAPSFDQKKADYTSGGRLKTIDDPLSRDEAKYYTRVFQEWHDGMEFPNAIRLGRDGVAGDNTKKEYKKYRNQYLTFLNSYNTVFNPNVFPQIRIARIDKYLNK